jgi:predicted DNA binding CopG/RHH family protein
MKSKTSEADAMVKLTVRLRDTLVERAKIRAIKEKVPLQNLMATALEAYLKTAQEPKGKGL